jgi:(3,5-dihydroxyphenyl)acetyl-CoA 1,2-dioxygenase
MNEPDEMMRGPIEAGRLRMATQAAGLGGQEIQRWLDAASALFDTLAARPEAWDAARIAASDTLTLGDALLRRLPPRPRRDAPGQAAAEAIKETVRDARTRFLRAYAGRIYADLTGEYRETVRADELVYRAAERFPGLAPTRAAVESERQYLQKEKEGLEIDQGLFLSQILAHRQAGAHLCWAMLRPRPEAYERLEELQRTGSVDLGAAVVRRDGPVGQVLMRNPRFLNAEDDATLGPLELAIDLATLDPAITVGVLRGATVDHPRYRDRHVFSAGINLTHLYHGQISYLFYVLRELGAVNKLYRGLAGPEFLPDEPEMTLEKPWIAAVEAFAIGGGCQILLVMDHVLAEAGSFFNLPARKEGIIPGAANLRLPRLVGERLARQGILFDRRFEADSSEGRLLCDEIVPTGGMDAAIERAANQLGGSGTVSAAGNRKALRVGQEPRDLFQAYMATYAREQAYCHFSPALIHNLEANWSADRRRP